MRHPLLLAALSLSGAFGIVLFGGGEVPRSTLLPPLPTLVSSTDACPLSPEEEDKAVKKFDEMWPVIRHPRCLNCHGVVNPLIDEAKGHHGGGKIDRPEDPKEAFAKCHECHYLEHWDTPASLFFFTGRSARQLCMQFKAAETTPTIFVRHMDNDKGGTPFIETAFKGDRGLDQDAQELFTTTHPGRPFQIEKPPMSHGEFLQIASDWANLVGEKAWSATPDCGCGRKKKSVTGSITTVWNLETPEVKISETLRTNVRYEVDSTYDQGPDDFYWSSVSGTIQWTSVITGRCHANASGTVRIGLGGDQNPMGNLHLVTNRPNGPRYFVGIGPWRDADQPQISVVCDNVPQTWPLNNGGLWWHHAIGGIESPDGKALQGTYTAAFGAATGTWTWDLQLDQ